MTKIVKVLDKGGTDIVRRFDANGDVVSEKEIEMPRMVLERRAVDATEIVAADPDRFEILADEDESPIDHDIQGNIVKPSKKKAKVPAKKAGKASGDAS